MERSNQPPKTECCREQGQVPEATEASGPNDLLEAYTGKLTGRKQVSPPAKATQPRYGAYTQVGTESPFTEPKTSQSATGKGQLGLPGSKSVAYEERAVRNLGDPVHARRTNCESQAGRPPQRQEVRVQRDPGVRLPRSSSEQPSTEKADASQGGNRTSQPAKETGAVRTTEDHWPTSLRAIAKKAQQQRRHRFGGLYRLLNEQSLRTCFYQLRKGAAPGVDGVTFKDYEKDLEANLRKLVQRLRNKSYHARLVRRKYIPKGEGKWRPLGIPVLEDKLVQLAVARILSAIYEADFLPCNQGYRLNRGAQQAARELAEVLTKGRVEFVDEVDIKGYFDHLQHPWLLKMLGHRIADGALLGLIAKWLKAGILEEDGQIVNPVTGTPQGGSVSPVLANVYLHYVLDLWFEHKVLARKYRGYWNYYGVRGNFESLGQFFQQTRRILHKWLNRRSQRKSYTALGFERLLRRFQIPHPRIVEIVEKEPVPIRRDPVGVEAALDVLFGRNNHPPSRA